MVKENIPKTRDIKEIFRINRLLEDIYYMKFNNFNLNLNKDIISYLKSYYIKNIIIDINDIDLNKKKDLENIKDLLNLLFYLKDIGIKFVIFDSLPDKIIEFVKYLKENKILIISTLKDCLNYFFNFEEFEYNIEKKYIKIVLPSDFTNYKNLPSFYKSEDIRAIFIDFRNIKEINNLIIYYINQLLEEDYKRLVYIYNLTNEILIRKLLILNRINKRLYLKREINIEKEINDILKKKQLTLYCINNNFQIIKKYILENNYRYIIQRRNILKNKKKNEIIINVVDVSISRERHACFEVKDEECILISLKEDREVKLNFEPIKYNKEYYLNDGDIITIGNTTFLFKSNKEINYIIKEQTISDIEYKSISISSVKKLKKELEKLYNNNLINNDEFIILYSYLINVDDFFYFQFNSNLKENFYLYLSNYIKNYIKSNPVCIIVGEINKNNKIEIEYIEKREAEALSIETIPIIKIDNLEKAYIFFERMLIYIFIPLDLYYEEEKLYKKEKKFLYIILDKKENNNNNNELSKLYYYKKFFKLISLHDIIVESIREYLKSKNIVYGLIYSEELKSAKKVQYKLLPTERYIFDKFELSYRIDQYLEVGGDYFDLIYYRDKFYLILGDVSGHGISSALILFYVKGVLNSLLKLGAFPNDTLKILNKEMRKIFKKIQFYITLLILEGYKNSDIIKIYNCGHNPPLIYKDDTIQEISLNSTPLGWLDINNIPHKEIRIEKKQIIILYSDGIIECKNLYKNTKKESLFGIEALKKVLLNSCNVLNITSLEIIENVYKEIESHIGESLKNIKNYKSSIELDDMSLVLLKRI